jgi:clan AA aspartic protease (TIGR02281 family)
MSIARVAGRSACCSLLAVALASCQPAAARQVANDATAGSSSPAVAQRPRIAAAAYRPDGYMPDAATPRAASRRLQISADPASGSFLANVFINGVQITAIIDTGAQATILSARDARATGADRDVTHSETMAGIGGLTQLNVTRIRSMEVGGQELGGFSAVIGQTGIPYTLLGQTELSRLGRIVIQDGVMTIGEAVNQDGTYRR